MRFLFYCKKPEKRNQKLQTQSSPTSRHSHMKIHMTVFFGAYASQCCTFARRIVKYSHETDRQVDRILMANALI